MRLTHLPVLFALACASSSAPSQPPASPASPAEDDDWEGFDPSRESPEQPFRSFNPMRGPALSINGLRFAGPSGTFQAMISAYDEDQDIVFLFLPSPEIASAWLEACPPSPDAPEESTLKVTLHGAGDLSHNVLQVEETRWMTSLPLDRYAALPDLRLNVCGSDYTLDPAQRERFQQHAILAQKTASSERR